MKTRIGVLDLLLAVSLVATLSTLVLLATLHTYATWPLIIGLVLGVVACILLVALRPHGELARVFIGKLWNALDAHSEPDARLNRTVAVGIWLFFGCFLAYRAYNTEMGVLVTVACSFGSVACFLGGIAEMRSITIWSVVTDVFKRTRP